MAWEETDPGVYRAELGGSEKIFHKVATLFAHLKREHYRIHCICQLEFGSEFPGWKDPGAAVREAWRTLRSEFPSLGVRPNGHGHKVYRVLDAQGEQDWLDQTFSIEPRGKTSDEVIAREPSDLPSLYFLPSSSEVVFTCSHWRIDAIGTNWVLDRLLTHLAKPPPIIPHSVPNLDAVSPALEEAVGAPEHWTEEQEDYALSFIQSFREDSFPNDRMRYNGNGDTLPGNPARQSLIFDPLSTASLIVACKAGGISVTAAVHSALAQSVFALADSDDRQLQKEEKNDYTCATSINLRPKLPGPYNTRAHAVQTYVMGVGCRVRRDSGFADAARALTRHYKAAYNNERVLQSLRPIYKFNGEATPARQRKRNVATVNRPTDASYAASVPPSLPPSGITISSIGVVDKYLTGEYGAQNGAPVVSVRKYHFGINMMTRQMILYVWTFRGQLQLSVNYNAGYYDLDVPLDLLMRVKEHLERGLKMELVTS